MGLEGIFLVKIRANQKFAIRFLIASTSSMHSITPDSFKRNRPFAILVRVASYATSDTTINTLCFSDV